MATLKTILDLENKQTVKGFEEASRAVGKYAKKVDASSVNLSKYADKTVSTFAGMGSKILAAAGIGSIGATIAKSIGAAAEMETLETAFEPLLGSAEMAEQRMKELAKFAAETPFELPEIAKASKELETLTKGALATGKGLEMVGDIAASTNRPFDEVAVSVGRLYDGLQSGRPVGEAMMRLQELGAISGDTRAKIEALQKEGKKGDEVWIIAERALGRFSGSMEKQSQTWNGRISTLKDNVNLAFAAMGQPVIDSLSPILDSWADKDFTEMGQRLGEDLAAALDIITSEDAWELFKLNALNAIGELQASPVLNDFLAALNAGFDWAAGGGFKDNFNKYYDAGKAAQEERLAEYAAEMDAIHAKIDQRRADREKKREEDKAYERARMDEYKNAPAFVDPTGGASNPAALSAQTRFSEEMEVLKARLDGDQDLVASLERKQRIEEEILRLKKEQLGISEQEANSLATAKINAQDAVNADADNQNRRKAGIDLRKEMEVLRLRAAGKEKEAAALEREFAARAEAVRISEETFMSEKDALAFVRERQKLEDQIERNKKKSATPSGRRRGIGGEASRTNFTGLDGSRIGQSVGFSRDVRVGFSRERIGLAGAAADRAREARPRDPDAEARRTAMNYYEKNLQQNEELLGIWKQIGVA